MKKEELLVVKTGGAVIDDEDALFSFLKNFALLPGKKILVHGGGKAATALSNRLDIPQQMIDGRRITDAETLKVITMVYAGLINKNIVAQLQSLDCNAIGLSGADGNVIAAQKRAKGDIDFGFVGDVESVQVDTIEALLNAGLQPIIAPLTHDGKGSLLNTNADTIAQEIAQAFSNCYNVKLIYCFEKRGVLNNVADPNSVIANIDKNVFEQMVKDGKIANGMLPKLHNSFRALNNGVMSVAIGHWREIESMITETSGTKITLQNEL